ncbi:hypothetical protein PI124_g9621 [Phytophthora idaei]|nr:hypothetical protein PI125_g10257 [Phytophthora idaei]KAG3154468.1 hypothetical protein PI126_g9608 [Phytophthora idaei]KAG3245651.1 hypothetical protein PI124_g9621 [Phytophthora idaei]
MGKDDRHYQPTGGSHVNDYPGPFWWVDDIVIIEADIGDRLLHAERCRRDAMKLVFGSGGLHEGKFRTWPQCFHCVGIEWNTPDATVTILQRKIDKTKPIVAETLTMRFISQKGLDSLVGILRHIVTFIPVAKPFMQRLIRVQLTTKKSGRSGTPRTDSLRDDLTWWNELVFENEFTGIPMSMFGTMPPERDGWVIIHHDHIILVHGLTPRRTAQYTYDSQVGEIQIAHAILQTLNSWVVTETTRKTWHHIRVYVREPW